MKDLLHSGRAVFADIASTLLFLALFALTRNVMLAVTLGMALAFAQIGWQRMRGKPVDALQWISLFLVVASGSATLFTHNPVFVMLKPSAIYLLVGGAMMRRGWMLRYMPPRAMEYVPDVAVRFGYVWAGLMVFSAVLNLVLALRLDVIAWGAAMTAWGIASKLILFFGQYAVMKIVGRRRYNRRGQAVFPQALQ